MKSILTLILSVFLMGSTNILAQEYLIVPADTDQLVFRYQDQLFLPSVGITGELNYSTNVFWEKEVSFDIDDRFDSDNCLSNSGVTVLGSRIRVSQRENEVGYQHIMYGGKAGAHALFKVSASVGESWNSVTSFLDTGEPLIATYTKIEYVELGNGVMDSIKTFELSNDLCDVIISKNHGVIQTPNWNFSQSAGAPCLERVWEEAEIVQQTKTPFGDLASDLKAGDELHILEMEGHESIGRIKTKEIRAIFLSKDFDNEKGEYNLTFAEEVNESEWIDGVTTERTYRDTTITVISRWPGLEIADTASVPVNQYFWADDNSASFVNYGLYNERLTYSHMPASFREPNMEIPDGCFPLVFDLNGPYSYYNGLAGPYYNTGNFYPVSRMLQYYRKGEEEFGDPFEFLVSTEDKMVAAGIEMFPNPVGEYKELHVTNLPADVHLVQIVDLTGKTVHTARLDTQIGDVQRISLPNLNQGVYLVSFQTTQGNLYYKKLMK